MCPKISSQEPQLQRRYEKLVIQHYEHDANDGVTREIRRNVIASPMTDGSTAKASGIIGRDGRAGRGEIDIASLVDNRTGVLAPASPLCTFAFSTVLTAGKP